MNLEQLEQRFFELTEHTHNLSSTVVELATNQKHAIESLEKVSEKLNDLIENYVSHNHFEKTLDSINFRFDSLAKKLHVLETDYQFKVTSKLNLKHYIYVVATCLSISCAVFEVVRHGF